MVYSVVILWRGCTRISLLCTSDSLLNTVVETPLLGCVTSLLRQSKSGSGLTWLLHDGTSARFRSVPRGSSLGTYTIRTTLLSISCRTCFNPSSFAFAISILSETRRPLKHEPPNLAIDEVIKHKIINDATAVIISPQQRVTGSRYLGNSERCPSLKAEQKLHLSS